VAGVSNFDLASFVNSKVSEKNEKLKLEKCPDKNAKLNLHIKILFLGEVKDFDLMSTNTSRLDEDLEELDLDKSFSNLKPPQDPPVSHNQPLSASISQVSPGNIPSSSSSNIPAESLADVPALSGNSQQASTFKSPENNNPTIVKESAMNRSNAEAAQIADGHSVLTATNSSPSKSLEIKVEELTEIKENLEKQKKLLNEKIARGEEEIGKWKKEVEEGRKKIEVYFILIFENF
jgi:N-terminal C2 in EEIG1 and EHBP1 proteins